jgi:hypothetical protein
MDESIMSQTATPTTDIIDHSIYRLQQLFGDQLAVLFKEDKRLSGATEIDGTFNLDGDKVPFMVREELTLGQLKQLHKRELGAFGKVVLLLGYSDEAQREYCRDQKINFLDQAGNCFINLPSLRVAVDGIPNLQPSRTASRAFQKSGLKLLYAFERAPGLLRHPFKNIGESVGIAKGTVGEAMTDLRRGGFLEGQGEERVLVNGRKLVEKWAYSYLELLRPTLHRGFYNYRGDNIVKDICGNDEKNEIHYSGTYAADQRANYLRGFDAIIYSDLRLSELREKLQLVPIGKKPVGETIEVLHAIEPVNVIPMGYHHLVGDLILYADLINSNDTRVLDAAEKLLNNEIRSKFLQNGFRW